MFDKLAKRLLQPVNTSVISIMGIFNLLLGFWLILPFRSLSKYEQSIEFTVGAGLLTIGIIILYGALRERFSTLGTGAIVGFIFWIIATGLAIATHFTSTDWIFTLMIAVYHGFVGVNILVNNHNLPNKN
jgi:hypothetical protein